MMYDYPHDLGDYALREIYVGAIDLDKLGEMEIGYCAAGADRIILGIDRPGFEEFNAVIIVQKRYLSDVLDFLEHDHNLILFDIVKYNLHFS